MSKEDCRKFYERLEKDPALRQEALSLKEICTEQETLMEAFRALGGRNGFHFTVVELAEYIFENAPSEKPQ